MASAPSGTSSPRDSPAPSTARQKSTPNGLRSRSKQTLGDSDNTPVSDLSSSDQHSHDRLLFLTACAVGSTATVTTISGDSFAGIFSGASLDKQGSKYVLKMVKKILSAKDQQPNGVVDPTEYVGYGGDHIMTFDPTDISYCTFSGLQLEKTLSRAANGTTNNFRTDTDISGNLAMRTRELKPWDPVSDSNVDMSLNTNGHTSWDQFEANERLYGVKTDYNENMYTTSIDRSHPTYKQRAAAADRKAREIETAGNSNVHRAGLENEMDEEERYAEVKRDVQPLVSTNPNSYKPPARRAPTAAPTVPGAPVDPAIISSQLSRPDTVPKSTDPANLNQPPMPLSAADQKENVTPSPETATPGKPQPSNQNTLSESVKGKLEAKPDLAPNKSSKGGAVPSPGKSVNATETVERDVVRAFKDFSNSEKIRLQQQQRVQGRKEREVKINDLKKFASNFKLPKPVPDDLIGILAKDPKKQDEIMAKALREAEEKKNQQKPAVAAAPVEQPTTSTPVQPDSNKATVAPPVEPSSTRSRGRGFQGHRNDKFSNSFGPGAVGRGGAPPQTFGQRLKQQYQSGPGVPAMPPIGPAALQTDLPFRQPMIGMPNSASSASRFNATAIEFKPNPASTFPPAGQGSIPTSQAGSRPVSKTHSPTKRSFFEGNRPRPFSERPTIRNDFNPIKRLKMEVEKEGKAKEFESNDGIPYAYMTRPTWDVRPENENKSYAEMFDQRPVVPLIPMPHQHQLPPHLQQNNQMMPHMHPPHHNSRYSQPPSIPPGNAYHHDDHRMQLSSSQSSQYQSPRVPMAQPSPMSGQHQQVYMQPQQMFMNQQGVPVGYIRSASTTPQMFNAQTGQMQPMMMNAHPNGQFVPGHGQPHVQMYSPAPGQAYSAQGGPGTPNYSPRAPPAPPMMAPQGSQQGHGAPMMYVSQSQQGQPMYYPQPQGQPMPMRGGGYPMQPQGSYGSSPHVQSQYSIPHRAPPQQFGAFPQQQMHPVQPMAHQNPPHSEVK